MRLFIAEKESAGTELANVLFENKAQKQNGCYTMGNDTVTWLSGHLLELYDPKDYKKEWEKWDLKNLPIIPSNWQLKAAARGSKQLNIVQSLIAKATQIVHAGDPDREGQLIVDEVLEHVQNTKPVQRLLLNSLDEKSIKTALNNISDNKKYQTLKQSAQIRQKLDWLVGMNASRAFTLKARQAGYSEIFRIGRVKTPTLALIVQREQEIKRFKPVKYFNIEATAKIADTICMLKLKNKINGDLPGLDCENRLVDKTIADKILFELQNSTKKCTLAKFEQEDKTEKQPLLFSLSSLQIEAGKTFGIKAAQTLEICQKLYEQKLLSYPRSDCQYVPETQFDDRFTIMNNLQDIVDTKKANLTIKTTVWNDKKINAHHAIIPTVEPCDFETLSQAEQQIYKLVAKRYAMQFLPIHKYKSTKIEVLCNDYVFTTTGKCIIDNGWKDLTKIVDDEDNSIEFPATLAEDENLAIALNSFILSDKITTAPQRYTDSSLLEAMVNIHKHIQNENLKANLKGIGLGTEATRSSTIASLSKEGYVSEEGKKKYLIPSAQANLLYKLLPTRLIYPDYTAMLESNLELVAEGKLDATLVTDKTVNEVKELVADFLTMQIEPASNYQCLDCGKPLVKKKGTKGFFWGCSGYPDCKKTFQDKKGEPNFDTMPITANSNYKCPSCDKPLAKRKGTKGFFWGCSAYPNCKTTFQDKNDEPDFSKDKNKP